MPRSTLNRPVQRMAFATLETQPILAMVRTYRQTLPAQFDMHYPLELGLVLSGRMRRYCQGWQTDLTPGQVWLNGVWETHGFAVTRVPCRVVVLIVAPALLAEARLGEAPEFSWMAPFLAPPPQRPQVPAAQANRMLALGRRLQGVLEQHPPQERVWLRLLLMEALVMLAEFWEERRKVSTGRSRYSRQIGPALERIFASHQRLTVEAAASVCRMSRGNFSRSFRESTGLSFARFALRYRLSQAAAELVATDQPIKTIAFRLGFVDDSHLHHLFRQHYRCAPAEYRRRGQHQGKDK